MKAVKLKTIVFGGRVMDGYFIEFTNNEVRIWSNRKGNALKRISIPKSGSRVYPGMVFRQNGEEITADLHRVIAENIVPFPRPECITKKEWDNTPIHVRDHFKSLYFVNHINHNKYDCHPSNLEWVTSKGNSRAYHAHIRG